MKNKSYLIIVLSIVLIFQISFFSPAFSQDKPLSDIQVQRILRTLVHASYSNGPCYPIHEPDPINEDSHLRDVAKEASARAFFLFSFSFENADKHFEELKKEFTSAGWDYYSKAFWNVEFKQLIKEKKLRFAVSVLHSAPPARVNSYVAAGALYRSFSVRVPLSFSLVGENFERHGEVCADVILQASPPDSNRYLIFNLNLD